MDRYSETVEVRLHCMQTRKNLAKVKATSLDGGEPSESEDSFASISANGDGATNLEARFLEAKKHLSSSRERLLNQILNEADETFFLSSRELANRYGVDAATIVRTVQAMGYPKFADFSHDLRNHFVTQITPYSSMRAATQESKSVS